MSDTSEIVAMRAHALPVQQYGPLLPDFVGLFYKWEL